MSVDYTVFIGVYIIPTLKKITKEKEIRQCPNLHKIKNYNDLYCSVCGAKIIGDNKTVEDNSYFLDYLYDKYEDILVEYTLWDDNDLKVLLPNNLDYHLYNPEYFDAEVEITPEIIKLSLDKFNTDFKEIIEDLKNQVKSLEIKFGVITVCH